MGCPEYQKICLLSFLSVRKRLELVQNGSILHGGEANKRWFFKMGTGVRPRHLIANGHIHGNWEYMIHVCEVLSKRGAKRIAGKPAGVKGMNWRVCVFYEHSWLFFFLIKFRTHDICVVKNDDQTYYSQRRWGESTVRSEGYQHRKKREQEFAGKYEWYEEGII